MSNIPSASSGFEAWKKSSVRAGRATGQNPNNNMSNGDPVGRNASPADVDRVARNVGRMNIGGVDTRHLTTTNWRILAAQGAEGDGPNNKNYDLNNRGAPRGVPRGLTPNNTGGGLRRGGNPAGDDTEGVANRAPGGLDNGIVHSGTAADNFPKLKNAKLSQRQRKALQRAASQQTPVPKKVYPIQIGPLKKFHFFDKLPIELRLAVWGLHMSTRCFIELERGCREPAGSSSIKSPGSHHWTRVSQKSLVVPSILHVCHESRVEAQTKYELRRFESRTTSGLERQVWFNNESDIVYFGDNACVASIHEVSVIQKGKEIRSIAFNNSRQTVMCCDLDNDGGFGLGRDGGSTLFQAIHGFDDDLCSLQEFPGFTGLKNIYVMVKSDYYPVMAGDVTQWVGMRPAVHDGLTAGQIKFRKDAYTGLEKQIADIDILGALPGTGEIKKWVGDMKPKFHFMSFCPHPFGVDNRSYDALPIEANQVNKLTRNRFAFLNGLRKKFGCEITVAQRGNGHIQREIGFFGLEKDIVKAKAAIIEKLATPASDDGNAQ